MGKGIDAARLDIPVEEIDGTGRYVLAFSVRDRVFRFHVQEKA
jgi:hypothetical protein